MKDKKKGTATTTREAFEWTEKKQQSEFKIETHRQNPKLISIYLRMKAYSLI